MIQTVKAVIDENGRVRLVQSVQISAPRRALVTVLEEEPSTAANEMALLSETALAEDWNFPEEDDASLYLLPEK